MDSKLDLELARIIREKSILDGEQLKKCVMAARPLEEDQESKSLVEVVLDFGYLPYEKLCRLIAIIKDSEIVCDHCRHELNAGIFSENDEFRCPQCNGEIHLTGDGEELPVSNPSDSASSAPLSKRETTAPGIPEVEEEKEIGAYLGHTIDDMKVVELLGEGSMGEVYLAEDGKTNQKVAIKFLSTSISRTKEFIKRFRHEAEIASELRSPHIVKVLRFGEYKNTQYMVLEYIDGSDLQELIGEKTKLPPMDALDIIIQIAKGLEVAHTNHVAHRDIKPDNVFIDRENHAKIGDFGVAKSAGRTSLTSAGSLIGTPHYMSPEQAEGKKLDHRADIYSLGATFYAAVVGTPPFEGDSPITLIYKQINQPLSFPKEAREEIPKAIQKVIKKMMAKEPWRRHNTTQELVEELESIQKDLQEGREPGINSISSTKWQTPKELSPQLHQKKEANLPQSSLTNPPVSPGSSRRVMVFSLLSVLLLATIMGAGYYKFVIEKDNQSPPPQKKPVVDPPDKKKPDKPKDSAPVEVRQAMEKMWKKKDLILGEELPSALAKYPKSKALQELKVKLDKATKRAQLHFNRGRYFHKRKAVEKAYVEYRNAYHKWPRPEYLKVYTKFLLDSLKTNLSQHKNSKQVLEYTRELQRLGTSPQIWFRQWLNEEFDEVKDKAFQMKLKLKKTEKHLAQRKKEIATISLFSALERARKQWKEERRLAYKNHYTKLLSLHRNKYDLLEKLAKSPLLAEHRVALYPILAVFQDKYFQEIQKFEQKLKFYE